jgi:hypothetical protein
MSHEVEMMERAPDRLAVRVLEGLGRQLWGFPPRLIAGIVAELGDLEALTWFAYNMPRYECTLRLLGPLRTHLACTVISLHNGCRYCSFKHASALEHVHLEQQGTLFPSDAHAMTEWIGLGPGALRQRIVEVLERAGLHGEVLWVDRTLALAVGSHGPVDADEARIAHLVRMVGVLNAVGMTYGVAPDATHEPAHEDRASTEPQAALRESAV